MTPVVDAVLNSYSLLRASELLRKVRCTKLAVLPDFDEGDRALLPGSKTDRKPISKTGIRVSFGR
jgi:hypothetical protein